MPLENRASPHRSEETLAHLRAALGKLEVALGATQDSIAWTDERGRIEWCNAPFDRLAGQPHMSIIGQSITTVLPLDRWSMQARAHPAKAVLSSHSFSTDTVEILREGQRRFLEFFGSWAQGGGISPIAVFVVRDVTARKVREEDLRRVTAILEAQQEASLDGILIIDEVGRIVKFNERFAQMWALPAEALASGSSEIALAAAGDLLHDPQDFLERVRSIDADRGLSRCDELALKDGRVFERYTAPIRGASGDYYGRAWYYRDVTARKVSERALEEKSRELARSNAELQQFASAASHDLMEPLRKVAAFGDLLRKRSETTLDATSLDFLTRMQNAAVRMGRLIEDLLQFSRVFGDTRPFQNVDLKEIAEDVVSDLERAITASNAFIEIGALPRLTVHPFQMRQLFQNLIANAIKFRREGTPPVIRISSKAGPEGFVEITIQDNGIGFESQYAEKIFSPFLRLHTRAEYEGTGLGLAICRRILTRHGGWIRASAEQGHGATFVLTLPSGGGS